MSGERTTVTRARANQRVTVGLRPGETPADVEDEFARSFDFGNRLAVDGTESWHSRYRWLGPVKIMAYREVGPPPWRWPRIGIRRAGRFVRFIVGWRSTAYGLCLLWAGRHRG
jgi:hypothetical protein